jgi:hypothetical protein
VADQVVHDLEACAFPRRDIRVLGEPREMTVTGMMSTPRTDFQVGLDRDLRALGANDTEAHAYVQGVQRGGVLVFATGSNLDVDNAAAIMNRNDALELEEFLGRAAGVGGAIDASVPATADGSPQTGRVRQPGGGARLFVW